MVASREREGSAPILRVNRGLRQRRIVMLGFAISWLNGNALADPCGENVSQDKVTCTLSTANAQIARYSDKNCLQSNPLAGIAR